MSKKEFNYSPEKKEDFSSVKVNPKKINPDFVFVHKNVFWKFFSFIFYYTILIPIIFIFDKLIHHTKVINKKNITSQLKNTGYFLYSNHTMISDGYIPQVFICSPKRSYIVSLEDTLAGNKFTSNFLVFLGAIPVPSSLKAGRNFLKCLKQRLNEKSAIIIYPEGTIWPYYTSQRPSKPGAFKYPRIYNVPVVFACTTFRKPKGLFKKFKKPRVVIYLSDVIYPERENVEKFDEHRLQKLYEEFIEKNSSISENYSCYKYQSNKLNKAYLEGENKNDIQTK